MKILLAFMALALTGCYSQNFPTDQIDGWPDSPDSIHVAHVVVVNSISNQVALDNGWRIALRSAPLYPAVKDGETGLLKITPINGPTGVGLYWYDVLGFKPDVPGRAK